MKRTSLTNTTDKGKKFNARKETAKGEEYYGIKIFRFYIVSAMLPTRGSLTHSLLEMYTMFG